MAMKAIVLAAGKGTRLASESADLPKALRLLNGKPLIQYVLDNLNFLPREDITIVVGFLKDKVMEAVGGGYQYVEQKELIGTAKAALCAETILGNFLGSTLVCYCDMPFLRRETYRRMFDCLLETGAGHALLAGRGDPIPPYGRLIRDKDGRLTDIIEDSACTEAQRRIDEVNVGLQIFDGARMWDWLKRVDNDNPKGEYYLTGAVRVLAREGVRQEVVTLNDRTEMMGINTMDDLRAAEALLRWGFLAKSLYGG